MLLGMKESHKKGDSESILAPMLGPAACWQVQSASDFRAQLASAAAMPDIANQYPHDGNNDQE
jgi:hypothetical protein